MMTTVIISASLLLILILTTYIIQKKREKKRLQFLIESESVFRQKASRTLQADQLSDVCYGKNFKIRFPDQILTTAEYRKILKPYTSLYKEACRLLQEMEESELTVHDDIRHFIIQYELLEAQAQKHNAYIKKHVLQTHKDFFDRCLKYPLDEQQRRSIISEEDNTLVISSAGSGKTSSIVGKVKYLTQIKGVKPQRILLISYTNKAAAELTGRIATPELHGYTFHKLALHIIARHTGRKPDICDNTDLLFIRIFRQLTQDESQFQEAVLSYFVDYPNDESLWEQNKRKRQERLSEEKKIQQTVLFADMDGHEIRVKSKEENKLCFILTALGMKFRYEEPYEHPVEDEMHTQYRPDFSVYYTKNGKPHRLYLEHYGIDEHGLVPLWFAQDKALTYEEANQKYGDGITWKQETHAKYGTTLISTSSADFKYLDVKEELKKKLEQAGVPVNEKTPAELYQAVLPEKSRNEKSFIRLIATFVTLLKSNCRSIDDIIQEARKNNDNRAEFIISNIFKPAYEEYERCLKQKNQIDFTDAILQATDICNSVSMPGYDYIIVDEFQDISMDRCRFLKALRRGNPPAKLFCVGDDWQSIYRFSGSDMMLFSHFSKFFGTTETDRIETTYRFGQPLVRYSSEFIQRNPKQLKKEIRPFQSSARTELLFRPYSHANYCQILEDLIRTIPSDKSIFLLGRYSFDDYYLSFKYKIQREGNKIYYVIQGRKMEFLTVHKSKGLEADYVILLQCNKDNFGFPSLVQDDPVLNYVLSEKDGFQFSEERRLFYVAMTRAKVCTYVFYDERKPSAFVNEFLYPGQSSAANYTMHRNANLRWSKKADQELLRLYNEKKSTAYMSKRMGRSKTAIVMRLSKLLDT